MSDRSRLVERFSLSEKKESKGHVRKAVLIYGVDESDNRTSKVRETLIGVCVCVCVCVLVGEYICTPVYNFFKPVLGCIEADFCN